MLSGQQTLNGSQALNAACCMILLVVLGLQTHLGNTIHTTMAVSVSRAPRKLGTKIKYLLVVPPYTVHMAELRKPSTPMPRWKDAELLAWIALYRVERGAANRSTWVTLTAQPLCAHQGHQLSMARHSTAGRGKAQPSTAQHGAAGNG